VHVHKIKKPEKHVIEADGSLNSPLLLNTRKFCDESQFAGIVLKITKDSKIAEKVYGHNEYEQCDPASLTKMATLYVTLMEVVAGRLDMNEELSMKDLETYPDNLARLCLNIHSKLTVEQAIKAIVTRSAADAADLLAKRISGSISAFADRMNECADSLGMKNTHFTNASGSPFDKNKFGIPTTTAADMALLLWSLRDTYPQYRKLLGTREFFYRIPIPNHGWVPGAEIGKTGWVDASGFSSFHTFPKGDDCYIVGFFGAKNAVKRNAYEEKMFHEIVEEKKARANASTASNGTRHMSLPEELNINQCEIVASATASQPESDRIWSFMPKADKNITSASASPPLSKGAKVVLR
jgi:D-alanyl-D-alanine carboxypeptidase